MRKKLTAIGNSLGIIIDKPILELLGLDAATEVDVTTDGERLIIAAADAHRARIDVLVEEVMDEHRDTLRKLAQ